MNKEIRDFRMLFNALSGSSGDKGAIFPESDVQDFNWGARYIPYEVTRARRKGKKVVFNSERHEWTMPDGTIIKHN